VNAAENLIAVSAGGWWSRAEYHEQEIDDYRENPLLEALPPIRSSKELVRLLRYRPSYNEADRNLTPEIRQHITEKVLSFIQPLTIHVDLAHRISRLIRNGYIMRNPVHPRYRTNMEEGLDALIRRGPRHGPRATGMLVAGISGAGKTTGLEAVLYIYPQVIEHSEYRGRPFPFTQVVYLRLECPADSSVRGLCLSFFNAIDDLLGTRYRDRYVRFKSTVDMLLSTMARISAVHGLGVLVVDEIQCLASAKSGGQKVMLNFFSQLVNTIGVPVVLVGTPGAVEVVTREFRHARRGTGQGDLIWDRMRRDTDAGDAEWRLFCDSLWRYQYVKHPSPLTPKLYDVLYEESQGITDVVVKLYMLAQHRAIQTGTERVTGGLIRSVAQDSLRVISRVLEALRDGKEGEHFLASLDDVLAEGLKQIVANGIRATERLGTNVERKASQPVHDPVTASDQPPTPPPPKAPPRTARVRRSARPLPDATLMDLVEAGKAAKVPPYQALYQAGLIVADGVVA
jgi:hypothetical protein